MSTQFVPGPRPDLDQLVKDYGMQNILSEFCGMYAKKLGHAYSMYVCPYHDDVMPSLMSLNLKGMCRCQAGCDLGRGPGQWVSGLDMMKKAMNISLPDAVAMLQKKIGARPVNYPKREQKPAPPPWTPEYSKVLEWYNNSNNQSRSYLINRGIDDKLQARMKLGLKYHKFGVPYRFPNGDEAVQIPTPRITIPTFRTIPKEVVYNVALRRIDDTRILNQVPKRQLDYAVKIVEDMDGNDETLLDIFCGPKYISFGSPTIYNGHLLKKWDSKQGKWVYPELDHICIVEGQLDALVLTAHGVPAIAAKQVKFMKSALSAVKRITIIADNDQAGMLIANGTRIAIGKERYHEITDIKAHGFFKDPTDMYLGGYLNYFLNVEGLQYNSPIESTNPGLLPEQMMYGWKAYTTMIDARKHKYVFPGKMAEQTEYKAPKERYKYPEGYRCPKRGKYVGFLAEP